MAADKPRPLLQNSLIKTVCSRPSTNPTQAQKGPLTWLPIGTHLNLSTSHPSIEPQCKELHQQSSPHKPADESHTFNISKLFPRIFHDNKIHPLTNTRWVWNHHWKLRDVTIYNIRVETLVWKIQGWNVMSPRDTMLQYKTLVNPSYRDGECHCVDQ